MLNAIGYRLFFFSNKLKKTDERNTEIDFLIQRNLKVCAIEVKSSNSSHHKSLDKFSLKFKTKIGYKFIITKNYLKVEGDYIFIPFYMVFCL
jgi:predicted AAA+ superfamily ATPase